MNETIKPADSSCTFNINKGYRGRFKHQSQQMKTYNLPVEKMVILQIKRPKVNECINAPPNLSSCAYKNFEVIQKEEKFIESSCERIFAAVNQITKDNTFQSKDDLYKFNSINNESPKITQILSKANSHFDLCGLECSIILSHSSKAALVDPGVSLFTQNVSCFEYSSITSNECSCIKNAS